MTDLEAVPGLPIESNNRRVGWALVTAIALHLVLFAVDVPGAPAKVGEPKKPEIFVVKPIPYSAPPPQRQEVLPEWQALRVPVPDPDPDDLEPIRSAPRIEVDPRIPLGDVLTGIPEPPTAPEPTGILRVGGEVRPPVRIHSPAPRYTELARKARIEGPVVIETIIDETGRVTRAKVVRGLPMGLDQAALEALESWRFEPATLRGKPVSVIYHLTFRFELH